MNEDNGCGGRGVRALDLRCLMGSDGVLGGRDGHLLLLVSRDNRTRAFVKTVKHVGM